MFKLSIYWSIRYSVVLVVFVEHYLSAFSFWGITKSHCWVYWALPPVCCQITDQDRSQFRLVLEQRSAHYLFPLENLSPDWYSMMPYQHCSQSTKGDTGEQTAFGGGRVSKTTEVQSASCLMGWGRWNLQRFFIIWCGVTVWSCWMKLCV